MGGQAELLPAVLQHRGGEVTCHHHHAQGHESHTLSHTKIPLRTPHTPLPFFPTAPTPPHPQPHPHIARAARAVAPCGVQGSWSAQHNTASVAMRGQGYVRARGPGPTLLDAQIREDGLPRGVHRDDQDVALNSCSDGFGVLRELTVARQQSTSSFCVQHALPGVLLGAKPTLALHSQAPTWLRLHPQRCTGGW